mmetsp:Transcript_93010/g.178643  ORF Transcript_93010/g.178643 Transcript_93010/m.178643 type:complete len:215 (-) Transcript_93010:514-1158(-)
MTCWLLSRSGRCCWRGGRSSPYSRLGLSFSPLPQVITRRRRRSRTRRRDCRPRTISQRMSLRLLHQINELAFLCHSRWKAHAALGQLLFQLLDAEVGVSIPCSCPATSAVGCCASRRPGVTSFAVAAVGSSRRRSLGRPGVGDLPVVAARCSCLSSTCHSGVSGPAMSSIRGSCSSVSSHSGVSRLTICAIRSRRRSAFCHAGVSGLAVCTIGC